MKKYFQFEELGTNYRREIVGGITTFLAMAYILAVNPYLIVRDIRLTWNGLWSGICSNCFSCCNWFDSDGAYCKISNRSCAWYGIKCLLCTFGVVIGMKIPWETALTGVLISGVIFVLLSLSGIREKIINAIPAELKFAVGAGIGLFITFVGLQGSGIIVDNPDTLLGLGDLTGNALLAVFGIVITVILVTKGVRSGIFLGMIITAIVGMIFNLVAIPSAIVGSAPSIAPTFGAAFDAFGNPSDLFNGNMLIVILTFLFVSFFDTAGTLVAVSQQAGLMKDNVLPGAGKGLLADSLSIVAGATFGVSTTTSYVESTSGVAAGARSGFAAIVTGLCFILALLFSPLLSVITSAVTAPALIIVGMLMASSLKLIQWDRFEVAVPAFLTVIMMPLTYSIATGIACGFVFYPITMFMKGKAKQVHPIMYGLFVVFLLYFIFLR